MSEISKAYEPSQVETKWYQQWLDNDCFRGVADTSKEPFSIVIPPPNVTGVLHMGHILNNTVQDLLIRRARQQGKAAVWMPGTDHAGIATQTRVEKMLRETEGKTRHDLGREKFVETACKWRDEHGGIIFNQLQKIGASCDWDRNVHTLDEDYSHAVLKAFVDLYNDGQIYRGKRMVNWCPVSLTALSDEEVIMKPQKGLFYKMRYEIAELPGEYVEIGTTRPETLMGDTAVAIHPEDERYKHLHGKHVWRPFPREKIPFVLSEHVDREFGTGVLKVTPAHDRADWDIGQANNLPVIDVLNPDGTLNELAGEEFCGMDRFKARKAAAEKLDSMGLLVGTEDYENNVGFSERANVPIEPRLSDQWWLRYPKVEEAKKVVEDDTIQFYPERWKKTYLHWLNNIQDWCISRQLWWGHRIPVYYKKGIDRFKLTDEDFKNPELIHVSVEGPSDPENWDQEEDVLDTWASSWLWPFGTFGWPNGSEEQQKELDFWYPTSVLTTGFDIIFFWVARMIMAGLEFKQEIPFKYVYFNGLIRDGKGRKMSKSLGNSPDPLDLVEEYGADALRLGLLMIAPKGQDILFQYQAPANGKPMECPSVAHGRNFCNKLWNAARFRQMQDEAGSDVSSKLALADIIARLEPEKFDADDHAILCQLVDTLNRYDKNLNEFEFNTATQTIYSFFWNDFCDWYVEVSKSKLRDASLKTNCLAIQDICLRQVLLMLHPITPFITEQLWHDMGFGSAQDFLQNVNTGTGDDLANALSGVGVTLDREALQEIISVRDFVSQARALKAQYNVASKKDVGFFCVGEAAQISIIEGNLEKLKKLMGAASIESRTEVQDAPAVVTELGTLYLDLSSSIDVGAERERLSKEKQKLSGIIQGIEKKLSNESFVGKAPEKVVAGAKQQLADNAAKLEEIERLLKALG